MYEDMDIRIKDKFKDYHDNEIVMMIHNGDNGAQEFIMNKYKNLVRIKARTYFLIGADKEDIIQEGMIGLYKAIRDFNNEKKGSFSTFAELCINRQILSAIKAANRQKHIPLNSSLSLNNAANEDSETFIDLLSDGGLTNPEEMLINRENLYRTESKIYHSLSKLERKVLTLYLRGKSYTDIAKIMEREEKSIDNALQRIKRKVWKILKEAM